MPALNDLISRIVSSGLVPAEKIAECRTVLGDAADGERLLKLLVHRKLVTEWQATQLLAGRERGFFLDHYKLLSPIGAGGMGQVFLALDTELDRQVAVKVLPTRLATPDAVSRFRREGQAAMAAQHEHIVHTFELGRAGATHFLVMELVDGTNLAKYISKNGRLTAQQAARVGYEVAVALDHARRHGIIHRDIKPSNIMLTRKGRVKLADLGLAKFFGTPDNRQASLTDTGDFMGTVDYCAPEQAEDAKRADTRSDIYSLGCTLYHCLTGRVPFPGGTKVQTIVSHRELEPTPIRDLNDDAPASLADLIQKRMLAKRPEDRFQSPAEAAEALRPWSTSDSGPADLAQLALLADEEDSADSSNRHTGPQSAYAIKETTVPPARSSRRRRHRVPSPIVVSAILLFACAVGGIVLLVNKLRDSSANPTPGIASNGRRSGVPKPKKDVDPAKSTTKGEKESTSGTAPPGTSGSSPTNLPANEITNSIGMKLVLIPAGTFMMGSPETEARGVTHERPQHSVTIEKPFYMGMFEVTQAEFHAVMEKNPSKFGVANGGRPDDPVDSVGWPKADQFCRKLTALDAEITAQRAYRLPTEAEWEYACRGGTDTPFNFGVGVILDQGNLKGFFATVAGGTKRVGSYSANAFRLYDMHGNVCEWVNDWYDPAYYTTSPTNDPRGPATGSLHVLRGGGWDDRGDDARSAARSTEAKKRPDNIGFRVVCMLPDEKLKPPARVAEDSRLPVWLPVQTPTERPAGDSSAKLTNSIGMKLVLIPSGEFMMGSTSSDPDAHNHEKPQHLVKVTKPFYMGICEVTVGQFKAFAQATGYVTEPEKDGKGGSGF